MLYLSNNEEIESFPDSLSTANGLRRHPIMKRDTMDWRIYDVTCFDVQSSIKITIRFYSLFYCVPEK